MKEEGVPFWYPDLRTLVAVSMIAIFAIVVVVLLVQPMPMTEAAGNVLLVIIGMLTTKVGTIVDYYFGSNKEAKEQGETSRTQAATIATMAATAAPTVTNGAAETAAWADAQAANTPAAFTAYLAKFPTGAHAVEARTRAAL